MERPMIQSTRAHDYEINYIVQLSLVSHW